MKEYLDETYGGSEDNPNTESCFYCYTIKDPYRNMYYSGSKGWTEGSEHRLLSKYFTSSTVRDFKERLKSNPENFKYRVEYFKTREEAFEAEKKYHENHKVHMNTKFYNVVTASGTLCGSSSVLCVDTRTDNTYRVSSYEYKEGCHTHVSTGKMNVYLKEDVSKKLLNIKKEDFNPDIHIKELEGKVHVRDKLLGRNVRILRSDFEKDKERYEGVTKGKSVVYDKYEDKTKAISKEDLEKNPERYVNPNLGKVNVILKSTGKYVNVDSLEFNKNKDKYLHPNKGRVVVKNLESGEIESVYSEVYYSNKSKYLNLAIMNGISCLDKNSGEVIKVPIEEFYKNRDKYSGITKGKYFYRDLTTGEVKQSTLGQPVEYWCVGIQQVELYKCEGLIFTSKPPLVKYIRNKLGGSLSKWMKIKIKDLPKESNLDIEFIPKGLDGNFGQFKKEEIHNDKDEDNTF